MKTVLSLILLCCSMATMAQNEKGAFSIRPMAGVNLSDFSGGVSDDFYHMKAGLAVGLEAEYGISRSFSLSLGAFYSQMGAKVDGTLKAMAVNDEYMVYIENKDKGKVTCNYITLPLMVNFFDGYKVSEAVVNTISLNSYISTVNSTVLLFGIVFEIPTLLAALSQIGLITRQTLIGGWKWAVLVIAVLAAIITPADPFSMLIAAVPLALLYGISILVCKKEVPEEAEEKEEAQ